jgi:hypothetical protein
LVVIKRVSEEVYVCVEERKTERRGEERVRLWLWLWLGLGLWLWL